MGKSWLIAPLLFIFSCAVVGQDQKTPEEHQPSELTVDGRGVRPEKHLPPAGLPDPELRSSEFRSVEDAPDITSVPAVNVAPDTVSNMRPIDYRRPDARKRFNNYISNIAGPDTLLMYAGKTALLTFRNTPKEWGTKPEGIARRLANNVAKNVIKESVIYGLDEALKVDSRFYLSRDRSMKARFRNSIFSAVTARNRRGKRVIGIPRLAGSFASGVIASTQWYPNRYDHDHGLKGGAIAIGVTAGVNLFREFVLKR